MEKKMYEAIFSRSFSQAEQKKLGVWAFTSIVIIAGTFVFSIYKPFQGPVLTLNAQLPRDNNFKMLSIMDTSNDKKIDQFVGSKNFTPLLAPICNFSQPRSDFCEIEGDIRIHPNSSTIFFFSPHLNSTPQPNVALPIKPYARKTDPSAMKMVTQFILKPSSTSHNPNQIPQCSVTEGFPAIVFSTAGYTGNYFHDFTDVIIPLFITSRPFKGEVQFLIADKKSWWVNKFGVVLQALSKYEIIDLDKDTEIRCFSKVIVGLKSHKELSIDPSMSPGGYSMRHFTQFLRRVYSLKREISEMNSRKPRLLILSGKKSRCILNEEDLAKAGTELGYDVLVIDARQSLWTFSRLVNSFDVMVGVHGAGLTNAMFLPEKAILVQVVPLALEWIAKHDFEIPAKDMNLNYLEYKVSVEESSLVEKYGVDHPFLLDPTLIMKQGWDAFRAVYLDSQDVRIDVPRFKATLLKALELLRKDIKHKKKLKF